MKSKILLLLAVMIHLIAVGCISTKDYESLQSERDQYKDEISALKSNQDYHKETEEELKNCEAQLKQSYMENEELTVRADQLKRDNDDLTFRFNELLDQNNALLSTASYEKQSLQEQLAALQGQIDLKHRELETIQFTLEERQANLNDLKSNLGEREERIAQLEAMLNAKDAQMLELRKNVNDALLGFSANDLTVDERDGKLYVSLSQDLLFKSGSNQIDFKGVNAIKQLAEVLATNQDIEITVEGHTDSDGTASQNWDLSVLRATSVVKLLTQNGVDPSRVTASGRAYFAPLVSNDNNVNKAKNRRTEIILSPKLDQLMTILNQ